MIVIPLVFASISLGVAGIGDLRGVGRVGGKAVAYFFASTALAASLGLALAWIVRPGEALDPAIREQLLQSYAGDASSRVQTAAQTNFGIDTFVNIFTRNPIRSAADLDLLGIIVFAMLFGAALTQIPDNRGKASVMSFLEGLNDVVIRIVGFAMKLGPYGVAGLIFTVTSRFGFHLLRPLAAYVAVVIGALLFPALVNLSLIQRFVIGISPRLFFSRIRNALVTAFSTSSSSGTLPTALAVAEQNLGIPPKIAGFVLPLGSTMCMNGTALFEGMTVIFLCQVFGVDLTFGQMVIVMIMSVVTAIGAAGVPGGSIPLLVGILTMFGVPAEGIAIILGIDRILDMSRTTVNVWGDITATAFVAKSEGVWDASMVPDVEGMDAKAA
jgi:DAACS family dicarboxylate/amino acid:cation (Na+ or H+) symporter